MRLLLRPEHLRPIALAGDTLVAAGGWAVAARFTGTGETLPTWSAGVGIVLLLVLLDLAVQIVGVGFARHQCVTFRR